MRQPISGVPYQPMESHKIAAYGISGALQAADDAPKSCVGEQSERVDVQRGNALPARRRRHEQRERERERERESQRERVASRGRGTQGALHAADDAPKSCPRDIVVRVVDLITASTFCLSPG